MRLDIFIVLLVAAILVYRWYQKKPKVKTGDAELSSTEMVQDPNCQTYVPEPEAIKATISGRDHYFCSGRCVDEYRAKHGSD